MLRCNIIIKTLVITELPDVVVRVQSMVRFPIPNVHHSHPCKVSKVSICPHWQFFQENPGHAVMINDAACMLSQGNYSVALINTHTYSTMTKLHTYGDIIMTHSFHPST